MPNLTYGCEPTAFIETVVVRERWRRRGIAAALVEQALEDARATGCNDVQLLSQERHADDGGHGLYEKVGFEAEGFRRYLTSVPLKVMHARATGAHRSAT